MILMVVMMIVAVMIVLRPISLQYDGAVVGAFACSANVERSSC
jgi:hypothetical protein